MRDRRLRRTRAVTLSPIHRDAEPVRPRGKSRRPPARADNKGSFFVQPVDYPSSPAGGVAVLSLRSRPFSQTLFVFIVALIVLVVVGITVVDYSIAERNLREDQRLLENQTEGELANAIVLIEAGYTLFDDVMNRDMADGLDRFLEEYERAGRDPSAMNLTQIKHEVFADRMDLYVINASDMVEFTTYSPDQDLNFSGNYDIATYLDGIRNTSGFYPDRVVQDRFSGQIRKVRVRPDAGSPVRPRARHDQRSPELPAAADPVRRGGQGHPDPEPRRRGRPPLHPLQVPVGNATFRPGAELSARLDRVLESRTGFEVLDPRNATKTRYLFIDLQDPAYASDVSKIAELTYSTRRLDDALRNLVVYHALVALAALALGLVTAGIVARRLTGPMRGIVEDVDAIARGDLDHPIAPSTAQEFSILESSIGAMVGRLKGTIDQLRQREASLSVSEEKYPAARRGRGFDHSPARP